MDERRWGDLAAQQRAYSAGETRLDAGPHEAYIEVAARCNLRCKMCPITVDPRYQPGSGLPGLFTPELFERLAPAFPGLLRAHLFGLGEPTLNPHLFDWGRRLTDEGVEIWTTTNATLIDDAKAERFSEAGFSRVSISIDGATRATYERIRRGARFADALRGIRALGRVRRRDGGPRLALSFVGMASNLHELPLLVELADDVGADQIFVEELFTWGHPELEEVHREENLGRLGEERVARIMESAHRRADELGVAFTSTLSARSERREIGGSADALWDETPDVPLTELGGRSEPERPGPEPAPPSEALAPSRLALPWPCSEPWSVINVNASGEVRPCCFNDTVLGRLTEGPIDEIWNSENFRELRRQHARRRSVLSCDGCVEAGRVKRSPFLLPSKHDTGESVAPDRAPAHQGLMETPAEGDLVAGRLVVTGRLPLPRLLRGAGAHGARALVRHRRRTALPDVYIDGTLVRRGVDTGFLDGNRFALVMDLDWVSTGSHRLELTGPNADRPLWAETVIQVGRPEPRSPGGGDEPVEGETEGDLVAAGRRASIPVHLEGPQGPPSIRVADRLLAADSWICGRSADGWRGVALLDVADLAPGWHAMELLFDGQPPLRAALVKLSPPSFGSYGERSRYAASSGTGASDGARRQPAGSVGG